jgi:hypothetical protein
MRVLGTFTRMPAPIQKLSDNFADYTLRIRCESSSTSEPPPLTPLDISWTRDAT